MEQMTVEQWYGTIKTGLTKKLTENKEALPAGFNQQRFILNCITVIQDMMKDNKKKEQLEKINPETIPVCLAKAAYLGLDFFNGECYAIPYGGKSGDQTGREICIRSYYNKPWIHVYRYTGVTASASGTVNVRNYLQKGDSGDAVKEMQKMLIGCGFSCGSSGVDGSFGGDTEKALLAFQAFYGLEQDGKYGPVSKSKLVSAYNGKTAASVPEKKNTPSYTAGHEYTLQVELKVRTGPGTNYSAKKHSQLTADGQKHDRDNDGCLDAGTVVTCQEVRNVGNDIWMKAPSGWMAAYYDGKVYIK